MAAPLLTPELLDAFEAQLRARAVPLDEWTLPGATDDEIEVSLSGIGLTAPDELRVWWRWRNGVITEGRRLLPQPWGQALSVTDAIARYESCRAVARAAAQPKLNLFADDLWHPSWLPILGTAQAVAVECDVGDGDPSPVLFVDHEDLETYNKPRAGSLGEVVAWWISALQTGAWHREEAAGWWLVDRARLAPPAQTSPLL
jgi:hypothetical protein